MNPAMDRAAMAAFIREHTVVATAPLVPEVRLYLATEVTPLWEKTEDWLQERNLTIPFWAIAWPGGQALARYVLDHPEVVRGKRVVDYAAGGGIVALACVQAGARSVTAVDCDDMAAEAMKLNAAMADASIEVVCADWLDGASYPSPEVLLVGDIWYEADISARMIDWLRGVRRQGAEVLTADPGRHYLPEGFEWVQSFDVPTSLEAEGSSFKITRILRLP